MKSHKNENIILIRSIGNNNNNINNVKFKIYGHGFMYYSYTYTKYNATAEHFYFHWQRCYMKNIFNFYNFWRQGTSECMRVEENVNILIHKLSSNEKKIMT